MDGFTLDKIDSVRCHVYHDDVPIGYLKWDDGFSYYLPKYDIKSNKFPSKDECLNSMKKAYLIHSK